MDSFRKLGISPEIVKAIEEAKFAEPSLIQEKSIPPVLEGKDVIAGSATGSGKTLAFGTGIITRSTPGKGIQALVLTPTRELAEQVTAALKQFSKYKPLQIAAVYGGVSINPQIDALKMADVVVGTPGRIIDHLERKTVGFPNVKTLVLDEADRMLDMGFIDDVEKIIKTCPKNRQTLLFSATISHDVERLSKRYMKDPVKISGQEMVDPHKLKQVYYDVSDQLKFSLLVHLLKNEKKGLVMVFCNTRTNTDFVANNLKLNGIPAQAIHAGFSQDKRSKTIEHFHSEKVTILVCTDVAARGLDISGVTHVYNYDIPNESKQYVHRIGRTARAGKEGQAINILAPRDWENYTRVLRDNDLDIPKESTPRMKRVFIKWKPERRPRGRPGARPRSGPPRRSGGPRSSGPRSAGGRSGRNAPRRHARRY